jgi:signal transduction histidine kinase
MTLQAKLTLGSILLATLLVGLISAVDLGNDMQRQFDATLERADLLKNVATKMVVQSLNRQRSVPLRDALHDPDLTNGLIDIMAASHAVLEIAVVNPQNEILADSDPSRIGLTSPAYPDFRPTSVGTGWIAKFRILQETGRYFQLEKTLETADHQTLVHVRVIVDPALIRNDIYPTMRKNAQISLASIIGAVVITFLFSAVAFRPLGELGHMLDQVAQGDLAPDQMPAPTASRDEVSVIASKVSLLGQRLRGAQSEVSDLRGNFERLLQDLEDAVFIFSRERRLVFASGSVERFLSRSREELSAQSLAEIFPPTATLGLLIAQAAQTGRPIRNRRVPVTPAGASRVALVLLSVDPLESLPGIPNSGAGLLVRLRDPEATRKLGRELQTADRLAALSRISGGVAHEVKNPLNAILLHVEVARAKLAQGARDVAPEMEIISREILRLDRVVKTFLDFTRPVELNLSEVALEGFVTELVDLARPQAEASGIRITVQQDTGGVELRIDRDLMKQALLNIVVNAIEAMPKGGELRFEATADEENAEIRISDTGHGIPPELREKIFRLYFSTKQTGSGIGLAMTFRIVQLHDGTIDFTSEPNEGTAFFVRLPTTV